MPAGTTANEPHMLSTNDPDGFAVHWSTATVFDVEEPVHVAVAYSFSFTPADEHDSICADTPPVALRHCIIGSECDWQPVVHDAVGHSFCVMVPAGGTTATAFF